MKRILLASFLLFLTGCLAQPGNSAVSIDPTDYAPDAINTQLPEPSSTPEMNAPSPHPTARISQGSKVEYDHLTLLEFAVRDLALRLGVELNEIAVISIQSVDWPDSGLGCPLPGIDYAQMITPGYKFRLEAGGQLYTYHSNTELAFWLCQQGIPQLPLIPIVPGEIDDGIPWMPVDPVPTLADEIIIADPDPVK